jgi:hypothetical protein
MLVALMLSLPPILPSATLTATPRQTFAISRSRLRTPASRVYASTISSTA